MADEKSHWANLEAQINELRTHVVELLTKLETAVGERSRGVATEVESCARQIERVERDECGGLGRPQARREKSLGRATQVCEPGGLPIQNTPETIIQSSSACEHRITTKGRKELTREESEWRRICIGNRADSRTPIRKGLNHVQREAQSLGCQRRSKVRAAKPTQTCFSPRAFLLTGVAEKAYISCNPKFPEASRQEVEDSCQGEDSWSLKKPVDENF